MRAGIRIEPDWNVKKLLKLAAPTAARIRIEPDWNVKRKGDIVFYYFKRY